MNENLSKLTGAGILLALVIASFFWVKSAYNAMVGEEENVKTAWSQVENQYQRRSDLIPNLVNTVRGYATHERETLDSVIRARGNAGKLIVDPSHLDQKTLAEFQANQGDLSSALSRLMVVVERYPDLKASESFRELQVQLEGTENRIAVERMRFNETARRYNTYIRTFPKSALASLFGFAPKPYFAADTGADRAPTVDFSGTRK